MGRAAKDLTGRKFGRLKVISRVLDAGGSRARWLCQCKCGNTYIVRGDLLLSGKVRSCGCAKKPKKKSPTPSHYKSSPSFQRLEMAEEPFQNLANAVVAIAADDYRSALTKNNKKEQKEIEDFFLSDWYKTLTKIHGQTMICCLRREYENP